MLLFLVKAFNTIDSSSLRAGLAGVPTSYCQLLKLRSDFEIALSGGLREKIEWSAKTFSSNIAIAEYGAPLSTRVPRRDDSCKDRSKFALLKE